jgi:hypothetical protein
MAERPGDELRQELSALFAAGAGPGADLTEERFGALALRVFQHQFALNRPYAAYCCRRALTPDTVDDWRRIPAVPTAAFKEVALVAGDASTARLVFRTSGTTRGVERRGAHHVLDPALYHASLLAAFEACVLPDGARPALLSLIPSPAEAPDSSLSHMAGVLVERLGAAGSGWFSRAGTLDHARLSAALRRHERDGTPACLLGTSFAFVHWLDALEDRGERFTLPPGSRLMDTGGYKGRSRDVDPGEMRRAYTERLGIPAWHQVNEYGMTELLSQYYDARLRDRVLGSPGEPRRKIGPPWLRALVTDPETLEPLPDGATGILRHVDLANLDSVLAVQTEDLATSVRAGFLLLGRAPGATPRGCSIATDLLLGALRESPP